MVHMVHVLRGTKLGQATAGVQNKAPPGLSRSLRSHIPEGLSQCPLSVPTHNNKFTLLHFLL